MKDFKVKDKHLRKILDLLENKVFIILHIDHLQIQIPALLYLSDSRLHDHRQQTPPLEGRRPFSRPDPVHTTPPASPHTGTLERPQLLPQIQKHTPAPPEDEQGRD